MYKTKTGLTGDGDGGGAAAALGVVCRGSGARRIVGRTGRRAGGLGVEDGEDGVVALFPEQRVEATGGTTAARIFGLTPQLHKKSNTDMSTYARARKRDRDQKEVAPLTNFAGNGVKRRRFVELRRQISSAWGRLLARKKREMEEE